MKETKFPVYLKLNGGYSFYKIRSERSFEELQVIGERIVRHTIEAKQFPDIQRIQDMLSSEGFIPISEEEYLQLMEKVKL